MTLPTPERWAEIERLLDAALELAPEERTHWLGRMCAGDPVLRTEVQRLLGACEAAGPFLEEPAPAVAAPMFANLATDEVLKTGARLDTYEIVRELGRGGMATVYLAHDHKHRRRVAVKVLHSGLAAALGSQRFLREIQIAASLSHPHVLPLHDSGQAGRLLYYVMPYVEGESLRARLERERPLPLDHALQVTQQVLAALGYAHTHGVLHRDIKPENILLEGDQALVADFGIARALSEAGGERLTETGLTVGTPAYMSPEQASAGARLDGRSDLYSLGCVLYEMLAGEPPFTGPSAQAVIARQLAEPPRSLCIVRPDLPVAIERTVERALAKVPADRFATAGEFARALVQASTGASTSTATQLGIARPTPRRRLAGLALALLALAVAALLLARGRPAKTLALAGPKMLAVLPFKNLGAPTEQYFADGLTEEITSRLAAIGTLGVISRTSADRYRNTTRPLKQIGRELGVGYILEGSVRWERGSDGTSRVRVTPQLIQVRDDRHLWSDRYDADLREVLGVQAEIAEKVTGALGVALAASERQSLMARPTANLSAYDAYLRANALYPRDRHVSRDQLVTGLRRASEQYREAIRLDSTFALAYAKLGRAMVSLYGLLAPSDSSTAIDARVAIDRALALAPELGEAHAARGWYHIEIDRDSTRALQELERALAYRPNDAELLLDLAQVEWLARGASSQAIPRAERAALLDPQTAMTLLQAAELYLEAQRYDEAERLYDRVIALEPRSPGAHISKALIRLLRDGDIAGARAIVRQAAGSVDSMLLITAAGTRRATWHALGMLDESYQQALLELPPEVFADTAWYGLAKGYTYRARGDSMRFRAYYDTAFASATARLRKNPDEPWFHITRAWVLAARGQRAEAYTAMGKGLDSQGVQFWRNYGEIRARLAVIAGDSGRALDVLERGNWGPYLTVPWLKADPFWQPLRRNPRFQRLLERRQ